MTSKSQTYYFFEDPGHGWLRVRLEELDRLGLKKEITIFSYVYKDYAYLEEDLDAPAFLKAKEKQGDHFKIVRKVTNNSSRIRRFSSYSASA